MVMFIVQRKISICDNVGKDFVLSLKSYQSNGLGRGEEKWGSVMMGGWRNARIRKGKWDGREVGGRWVEKGGRRCGGVVEKGGESGSKKLDFTYGKDTSG
ncbi:hypothetical protein Tco_0261677 [Tanacetum coccineum]